MMIMISMKKLTFNCTLKLSKICKGSSDKSIAMPRIFQQALAISHSRNMCWTVSSVSRETLDPVPSWKGQIKGTFRLRSDVRVLWTTSLHYTPISWPLFLHHFLSLTPLYMSFCDYSVAMSFFHGTTLDPMSSRIKWYVSACSNLKRLLSPPMTNLIHCHLQLLPYKPYRPWKKGPNETPFSKL